MKQRETNNEHSSDKNASAKQYYVEWDWESLKRSWSKSNSLVQKLRWKPRSCSSLILLFINLGSEEIYFEFFDVQSVFRFKQPA